MAAGEFEPFTFLTPGEPAQIWEMSFSGAFSGAVHLTFGYDPTHPAGGLRRNRALPLPVQRRRMAASSRAWWSRVAHHRGDHRQPGGVRARGGWRCVTFTVDASAAPANSGTITGAGSYARADRA